MRPQLADADSGPWEVYFGGASQKKHFELTNSISIPIIHDWRTFVKNPDLAFWAMIKMSGDVSRFGEQDSGDISHPYGVFPFITIQRRRR
jgi:hypothetical protein